MLDNAKGRPIDVSRQYETWDLPDGSTHGTDFVFLNFCHRFLTSEKRCVGRFGIAWRLWNLVSCGKLSNVPKEIPHGASSLQTRWSADHRKRVMEKNR